MHYGQLAATGAAMSIFGIAFGQVWIPAGVLILVGGTALVIRARFRRGRTPGDR